ncbi:MAG: S9 family peptidase, partial [Actinobacteria bacterium]|nr:S9 family peptidase [Actinomycetota bacterium]
QISEGGTEESAVYVIDVATGAQLEGPIDRARYSPIAWLLDGEQYYYVRRLPPEEVPPGEAQYHRRVWLHRVGDDPANDPMIFGEYRKKTEYFGAAVSRDGRWLTISASEGTAPRNDLWVADLTSGELAAPVLQPVQVGIDAQTGLRFGRDGRVYIYSDRDAQRGRLSVTQPGDLEYSSWQTLIAEDPEAVFEGYAILDGPELQRPLLLVSWTRHAVSEISIHDLESGDRIGEIPLPGIGTVGGIVERPDGGHEAWFTYTDSATIPRVLRYDALADTCDVSAYPPGFVEVPKITSAMYTYQSLDGTPVRLMVLSPAVDAGEPAHPPRPTVLYGYGGFGIPMVPSYSPSVLAWVEAGGVYAIACLRGGSEEGEHWHRQGMLGNKQNVFDDFIAGAQWLIDEAWTTSDQLVISGGSNGGLLVGAAVTQRPDLFAGVHCSAPLLDMIRYETSGLGATWNVEYGSAQDPEAFGWLAAYSPYHRVVAEADYPALLFTTFDQDTRVDPMHARKMCAAMQFATSSVRPILLRSELDVGHGARSVSRSIDLSSDVLAFMAAAAGLTLPNGSEESST